MKRLNFTIYSKVVRPVARLAIGWVAALLVLGALIAILVMATGVTINYPL